MKASLALILCALCAAAAPSARKARPAGTNAPPAEIWLAPDRAAALARAASRPYVTRSERVGNTVVYHWTNGLHGACTTQAVARILGKPSRNGWQDRIDAEKAKRNELIADIDKLRGSGRATKKDLDAIAERHRDKP